MEQQGLSITQHRTMRPKPNNKNSMYTSTKYHRRIFSLPQRLDNQWRLTYVETL